MAVQARRASSNAGPGADTEGKDSPAALAHLLETLTGLRDAPTPDLARLESLGSPLQKALVASSISDRIKVLTALAELKGYPVGSYFLIFLEEYCASLGPLRDGETIADRAMELRDVLRCFHTANVGTERLRLVYEHIEQDFVAFEHAGALLPMPEAVRLCHTMLATGLSHVGAVIILLRSALREPLIHVPDDALELRLLKMIEMLIRLDFLHTQEQLPADVTEYLSVVRDLRFYDRDLRRDTALSYQLAFFLRKHGFPSKRHMVGPYALKVCDPDERINFEVVEDRTFRAGMPEEPTARKKRHLEAVGWRTFEVRASTWHALADYNEKARFVRSILKGNDLLSA